MKKKVKHHIERSHYSVIHARHESYGRRTTTNRWELLLFRSVVPLLFNVEVIHTVAPRLYAYTSNKEEIYVQSSELSSDRPRVNRADVSNKESDESEYGFQYLAATNHRHK